MILLYCLFLLITGIIFNSVKSEYGQKFDVLTENLLDNFYADPYLTGTAEFTKEAKQYIDKQVENYLRIVDRTYKKNDPSSSKTKRSLPIDSLNKLITDSNGTYILNGIIPSSTVPATFPKSIKLFKQGNTWYGAALVSTEPKENADNLIIFKQNGNIFKEIINQPVSKAQNLAIHSSSESTFIICAENTKVLDKHSKKTPVFQFTLNEELEIIQHILPNYSYDVEFWELNKVFFMAVSEFNCRNESSDKEIDLQITIYMWRNGFFDIIQTIKTMGSTKILPFKIAGVQLLAIANFNNKEGSVKTYSDIYKYNVEKELFEIHQKLLTTACVDIQYFNFMQNWKLSEHFLIVANSFKLEINGEKNYNTNSILYKFVEGYFIPFKNFRLNGVEKWVPIIGPKQEFLLIAVCKFEGIKIYQYDGWNFVESEIQFLGESIQKRIKEINFYIINETSTIVVSDENSKGDTVNVFQLNFTHVNNLNKFQDEMQEWCVNATESLISVELRRKRDVDGMLGVPGRSDTDIEMEEITSAPIVQTTKIAEDLSNSKEHNEIEELKLTLSNLNLILDTIEEQSVRTLQSKSEHTIKNDIVTDIVILNNDAHIENINAEEINTIKITDLMENTVNINKGFTITEPMSFDFIRIDHDISPKTINTKPTQDLMHTYNINTNNLVINGKTILKQNINVGGTINGERINEFNTLLQNREQNLNDSFINSVEIENIETSNLNGQDLSKIETLNFIKLTKLDILESKSILIGGYINDVDMQVLNKHSLRQFGDQELSQPYYFDDLEISDINIINTLNNKTVADLIVISSGEYKINRDIYFNDILNVNNLITKEFFNSIKVTNGKLDVLLKNSSELQYITSHKEFENLVLLKSLNLQGKIISEALEKYNPVKTITEDLELNENYTISGDVFIEEFLKATDIFTEDNKYSIIKLNELGLALNESEIPLKLQFVQEIHVDEVFVDNVNGINPNNWVVNGEQYPPQIIEGHKQLNSDVVITKAAEASNINGINISDLEENILTMNGDQIINGQKNVAKIIANSIASNNTEFATNKWKDVIISNIHKENADTIVINKNVKINFAATNNLQVDELINGINIEEMFNDTVTLDKDLRINGRKIIKNLEIDNLIIDGINIKKLEDIYDELNNGGLKIANNFEFLEPTVIENINFTEACNNILSESLGKQSLQRNKVSTYTMGQKKMKKIVIYGDTKINSDHINNVGIPELVENSVKIDEPFDFESVSFDSKVISEEIKTNSNVEMEGLDFNNLIHTDFENEQIVMGQKTFKSLIVTNSTVKLDDTVNNITYDQLCKFMDTKEDKNVVIEGNVIFTKGPDIYKINDYSVNNITTTMWLSNSPINMTGPVEFEDVVFKNNIYVQGKVDDINITHLAENYFSKTKNQTITGNLDFTRGLVFGQDVVTPYIALKGDINGMDLNEFLQTALINDTEQIFEDILYIENCTIINVSGNYKVNGLDLENDVMRYDKENMVTGFKNVTNLNVEMLQLDKDIQIEKVYILHLLKNGVLKTGNINISGKKRFLNKTYFSKSLSLTGNLNGNKFDRDSILLRNIAQNITGRKIFVSDNFDPIRLRHIKLKGLINGVDLNDVVQNQAMKNANNVFKSKMRFNRGISVKHLNIEKLYQGINVTELMMNVTNLNVMNNFGTNYYKLMNMSNVLYDSLKTQAYFLDFYKQIETFRSEGLLKLIILKCEDNKNVLVTFNSKTPNVISLYEWNSEFEMYIDTKHNLDLDTYPTYIQKVTIDKKDYIYLEYLNGEEKFGKLMNFKNSTLLITVANFKTPQNKTEFIEPFILPGFNKTCLIYMFKFNNPINIYCDIGRNQYNLYQLLNSPSAHQISVVDVQDVPHIIIINKGEKESFVQIWRMKDNHFQAHQIIYLVEPKSVSALCFEKNCFLAIASGHMENTMHPGMIDVLRYSSETEEYESWQVLDIKAPVQVQLAVLPSNELILYILTEIPMKPLIVYMYEGISGFTQHLVASTLMKTYNINYFNTNDLKHFIIAENNYGTDLIQAVFKGKKWT